ncbi:MAG: hypothetical protein OEY06_12845 [Gammaproteobacteria bacterium]|nr:hypothetical protein [Gammaproteobacteria bacterium]
MIQIISRLFITGALLSLVACGGGNSTPAPVAATSKGIPHAHT